MRTGNSALRDGTFNQTRAGATGADGVMTISGVFNPMVMPFVWGGLIGLI